MRDVTLPLTMESVQRLQCMQPRARATRTSLRERAETESCPAACEEQINAFTAVTDENKRTCSWKFGLKLSGRKTSLLIKLCWQMFTMVAGWSSSSSLEQLEGDLDASPCDYCQRARKTAPTRQQLAQSNRLEEVSDRE
ncbi:hypothetical protein AOLI_G00080330 [Acnodon oligacanthus]